MANCHWPAEAGLSQTSSQAGSDAVLGGCVFDPFLDLSLNADGRFVYPPVAAGPSGLVAVSDTHRDIERKRSWVTPNGSDPT